jgi:adenylate cyclase
MAAVSGRLTRWIGELRRRKVFRVAAIYAIAAWLVMQLADVTFESLGLPPWAQTFVIVLAAVGFPFACILAWAYDVTPQGIEKTAASTPAAADPAKNPHSVAILAFSDMSAERDQEYFCDGIAEEIINALCCIQDLKVASRTSSFQFKGRSVDSREIGRSLDVSHVLEGSVRKSGNRIRVTSQLIDAATGYHRWSQTFERELADVFAIQREIAQNVVRALRVAISPDEASRLERKGTRDPQAYDCYLRAKHLVWQTSDTAWRSARTLYRRAVEIDPQFAQAWAGLAICSASEYSWALDSASRTLINEAREAAEKAMQLVPNLAEALVAQGLVHFIENRPAESAAAFQAATERNPGLYEAWYHYGRLHVTLGDFERAEKLFERAMAIDEDDFQSATLRLMCVRRLERAGEIRQMAEEILRRTDRYLGQNPDDPRAHYFRGGALVHLDRKAEAFEAVERAIDLRPDEFSTLYNSGCVYALAGESDRALDLLDAAIAEHRGNLEWMIQDPDWMKLRDHPRYREILNRLRSTPANAP